MTHLGARQFASLAEGGGDFHSKGGASLGAHLFQYGKRWIIENFYDHNCTDMRNPILKPRIFRFIYPSLRSFVNLLETLVHITHRLQKIAEQTENTHGSLRSSNVLLENTKELTLLGRRLVSTVTEF